MNFLDFIKTNNQNKQSQAELLKMFECCQMKQANKTIVDFIKKEIEEKYIESIGLYNTKIGKDICMSELYVTSDPSNICFSFNWLIDGKSCEVYSVSFYENLKPYLYNTGKASLTINTLGQPLPYLVPLICYILKSQDLTLTSGNSNKLLSKKFPQEIKNANEMLVGSLSYKIFDNLSDNVNKETFLYNIKENIFESTFKDIEKFDNETEDWTNYMINSLNGCYQEIYNCVKGDKSSVDSVEVSISKKQSIIVGLSDTERKVDDDLQNSIKMYDKGINILNLIKDRLAFINPNTISLESKQKAYNYLVDLTSKNEKVKLSIKMISVCGNVFEATIQNADFNEEDAIELLDRQFLSLNKK